MERERPEYLPAIRRRRWEFPWLLAMGIILITLMAGGVHILIRTNAAWVDRFHTVKPPSAAPDPSAKREAHMAELRLRRAAAEQEAQASRAAEQTRQPEELRCIAGTPFRRIPGGWENIPNRQC